MKAYSKQCYVYTARIPRSRLSPVIAELKLMRCLLVLFRWADVPV